MYCVKKCTLCALAIIFLSFASRQTHAKSIYAITNVVDSEISAYKITGTELEYQTADCFFTPYTSYPVALALDPCSETLFASHDGFYYLALINAKTMELIQVKAMCFEPCGLAYDPAKQKLYASRRNGQELTKYVYIFSWDPETKQLSDDNNMKELDDTDEGIFGIALDDNDGTVYVSDGSHKIYMYDTNNDWSYEGYFEAGRDAVGIDVYNDGQGSRYLYAGCWPHTGSHTYLTRTDIDDPCNSIEVNAGEEVIGIAADDDTGLVYVTTFNRDIRVYGVTEEPNFVLFHVEETPGDNPADIVLAGDVGYYPPLLELTKSDDLDPNDPECVEPNDIITYTICYAHNDPCYTEDEPNVFLIDNLPDGAEFLEADPNNGTYDPCENSYTWDIGTLEYGDANCVELTVQVNLYTEPGMDLINLAELEGDNSYTTATEETPVCCWGGDVIYVNADLDPNNPGYGIGTSWADAYDDLQDALARAANGCGDEIWVAQGTYYTPSTTDPCSFALIDGVAIYGGFAGDETQRDQRNFTINHTKLSSDLNDDDDPDLPYVITADSSVTITAALDGFVVIGAKTAAVYCNYGDPNIANCLITDNAADGIRAKYSDVVISNCVITDNQGMGIHFSDAGSPTVNNCTISKNVSHGIHSYKAVPTIRNSCIHHNGTTDEHCGIDLEYLQGTALCHNNTIVYNEQTGIQRSGGWVDIANCIIWGNTEKQFDGCLTRYSCIQDGNDVARHNISDDPCFAYSDPNLCNYHLAGDSPCIEAGDPCGTYTGQTDIDDDDRLYNTYVDIGADEYDCEDVYNACDLTADGLVNLRELAPLSAAWLTDPNDDAWDPNCDFDQSNCIDLPDLVELSREWCWQACWRNTQTWSAMSAGTGDFAMRTYPATFSAAELQIARRNRLAVERANAPLTNKQLIAICEEILVWALDAYKQNDLPEAFDEKTFLLFIDSLYDWLKELQN